MTTLPISLCQKPFVPQVLRKRCRWLISARSSSAASMATSSPSWSSSRPGPGWPRPESPAGAWRTPSTPSPCVLAGTLSRISRQALSTFPFSCSYLHADFMTYRHCSSVWELHSSWGFSVNQCLFFPLSVLFHFHDVLFSHSLYSSSIFLVFNFPCLFCSICHDTSFRVLHIHCGNISIFCSFSSFKSSFIFQRNNVEFATLEFSNYAWKNLPISYFALFLNLFSIIKWRIFSFHMCFLKHEYWKTEET